jgi:hypothetical protein
MLFVTSKALSKLYSLIPTGKTKPWLSAKRTEWPLGPVWGKDKPGNTVSLANCYFG